MIAARQNVDLKCYQKTNIKRKTTARQGLGSWCCIGTGVADPYHMIQIRIQDLKKFVTDPDPNKTLIRIRIQTKKDSFDIKNANFPCYVFILLNFHFPINNHAN